MNTKVNNLPVFTEGKKENKVILFVHGFPYDHQMWDAQVKALSSNYFCVRYDLRGLGESPAGDGQFTMEMFVDDLEEIISGMNLNKPILCGLSMGGYISLRAMGRTENLFSALILCDTKSVADDNETKLKRADAIKRINDGHFNLFIEEFVSNCFADSFINESEKEYRKVVSRSLKNNPLGVKGCLLAMAGRTDTTEILKRIKIPTLVICGNEDKLSPPAVMKTMADKIPGSKYALVKGSGHMAPIEKAEVVNEKITRFLNRI
ncbi:MAG: alpha/beta fold hydrolase [Ignavibacteria bacterium]|nr:alpha/beta fold hydrolase [Ignavibacteria bacterium]